MFAVVATTAEDRLISIFARLFHWPFHKRPLDRGHRDRLGAYFQCGDVSRRAGHDGRASRVRTKPVINEVVRVERYVAAYDVGVAINPMLVEGQIAGSMVQGLGGALLEEFVYDLEGTPLCLTFSDYLMPTPGNPHTHHDALEFPDGQMVLLTDVFEDQEATVLQLCSSESASGRNILRCHRRRQTVTPDGRAFAKLDRHKAADHPVYWRPSAGR